jgi:hypothetical protein
MTVLTDTEILKQLIHTNAVTQLEQNYDRNCVVLREQQSDNYCLTIYNLPDDTIVIKADKFPSPDTIFQGDKGECKRADYILISEEKKCIIFLEMKRARGSQKEIVFQLKGAQCLMKYCQAVGISFWGKSDFLENYEPRFVAIYHTHIYKTKIRQNKQVIDSTPINEQHSDPEFLIKVSFPHHVEFNKIAALNYKK